jgi:hypothetical protein
MIMLSNTSRGRRTSKSTSLFFSLKNINVVLSFIISLSLSLTLNDSGENAPEIFVSCSGHGNSALYHELKRTYGFGDKEPDAVHDKPPEPEIRKPANLHDVGKDLNHEKLKEEFELFPDHHKIDNAIHWSGITALKQGIKLGNLTYVKTTLELGANVNATLKGSRPIHFSAAHCPFREQVDIAKLLVENGASVTDLNVDGYQAIHFASRLWQPLCTQFVEWLLSNENVHVDQRRTMGNETTPLHEAALRSSLKMVELLVEKGAEVDALDTEGDTPLHKAVKGDHLPAMHHLLKNGANPHLKNKRNISPLELAQKMKKDYDTMQVFKKDYGFSHSSGVATHTEL